MKHLLKIIGFALGFIPALLLLLSYWAITTDPLESKYAPVLAYGFPYTLLLNAAAILMLFILKQWKMGLLNLVVLLMGFTFVKRIYAFGSEGEVSDQDIHILSYNVRLFDRGGYFEVPKEQIRDSIFAFIKSQDADIVCFQEFYSRQDRKRFVRLEDVYEITGTKNFAASEAMKPRKTRFAGSYIFSKHPIIQQGFIDFNAEIKHDGRCSFADIVLPNQDTIRVYNFHLASISFDKQEYDFVENLSKDIEINDQNKSRAIRLVRMFVNAAKRRSEELKLVLAHAENSPYPTLLCGDLNDTPTSFAYHQMQSFYKDAFLQAGKGFGKTYSGKMPANRIDYIFHDANFQTTRFEIQREILSDHRAVQGWLRLN